MKSRLFFVLASILLGGSEITWGQTGAQRDSLFVSAILERHNAYRSELHLPSLTWSPALAADALAWARNLARSGGMQHDRTIVGREGENIWVGSTGYYSYSEMVNFWAGEKKDFVFGVFPDCKRSRSAVVGHYTQMVWRNTASVGCALTSDGKMDYLVCRYSPPGNVIGQKPY